MAERVVNYSQWAEIVVDRFQDNINRLDIGYSGDLFDSFEHHVNTHSNGNTSMVRFMFNLYGKFVDMGVGRDTPVGNTGDLGYTPRERKEWYSRTLYFEVQKLKEVLISIYGEKAAIAIIDKIESPKDMKSSRYGERNRARSMRNYHRRRKLEGSWVNNWKQWKPVHGQRLPNIPLDLK